MTSLRISQHNNIDEQEAWTHLAAELPDHTLTRLEDPDLLAQRDVDRAYDWDSHVGKFDNISTAGRDNLLGQDTHFRSSRQPIR
jgi:hypothetical protein